MAPGDGLESHTPGGHHLKKIAIANMKGGVGKSTSAMMLADVLSHHYEKRVLLIDCDPQSNLSQMILSFPGLKSAKAAGCTITNWIESFGNGTMLGHNPSPDIDAARTIQSNVSGLESLRMNNPRRRNGQISLWAATPDLRFAELAFDHLYFVAGDRASPRNMLNGLLKDALSSVEAQFDYAIFDCPPGFSTLSQSALLQADLILSPLNVDRVSLWSLMNFWKQGLEETLSLGVTRRYAFLTMVAGGNGAKREKLKLREDLRRFAGTSVLETEIPFSVQALRFVRRVDEQSYTTFNHKYGGIRKTVESFGNEVLNLVY